MSTPTTTTHLDRSDASEKEQRSNSRSQRPSSRVEIQVPHGWYLPCKFCCDWALAFLLLVPGLPIIALGALLVKLTSRGPAFFSQTRLGKDGRPYRIHKIRTMVHDAEAVTGPVWSAAGDPRVTRVGELLRTTHIDEFPQLVNILMGQMSLVGPRPERPEFVDALEWEFSEYSQRLRVRPGVTGLAQVKLPPDTDVESVRRKLVHDLYYIHHCNPWLDFRILIFTTWLLFKTLATTAWRLVSLPSGDDVADRVEKIFGAESAVLTERTDC